MRFCTYPQQVSVLISLVYIMQIIFQFGKGNGGELCVILNR